MRTGAGAKAVLKLNGDGMFLEGKHPGSNHCEATETQGSAKQRFLATLHLQKAASAPVQDEQ